MSFPFLAEEIQRADDNHVDLYRRVVSPRLPRPLLIGLVQPIGAIMPLAEEQAHWVADLIAGVVDLPSVAEMRAQITGVRRRPAASLRRLEAAHHPGRLPQVPRRAAQGARNPPLLTAYVVYIPRIHRHPGGGPTHRGCGMSVRQALLALLEREPMYGYQLRAEFEHRPVRPGRSNVGQVYTTLARLERDGLVEGRGQDDAEGRCATHHRRRPGRGVGWFSTPVASATQPPRDELAIKLALAVTVPGVDVAAVIQRQRSATITAMQDLHPAEEGRPRTASPTTSPGRSSSSPCASRRGGDPVARPLRGPPRPRRRDHGRSRQAAQHRLETATTGPPDEEPHGDSVDHAVLAIIDVTRIHGGGAAEVHALRRSPSAPHAGELVAVMGPSGSGKSTLLTVAGGLDQPTAGRVRVEGHDLGTLTSKGRAADAATSVGYVFQDFNLIPRLTAAENVALPLELDGGSTAEPRGRPPRRRSTRSASTSSPTGSPTTCPAASSSASRSPARSSATAG